MIINREFNILIKIIVNLKFDQNNHYHVTHYHAVQDKC